MIQQATNPNQSMINCKGCQKEIHSEATTCPTCGISQRSRSYKNKNVAGFLAFLLGGLGVHRFYLGQWWGIFYLLTIWTFIPMLIALIEAVYFWIRDVKKWDRKHNEGKQAGQSEKTNIAVFIIIGVVCAFTGIVFIGILAAIALPAYHDYTLRVQVTQAFTESAPTKTKVVDFYVNNSVLPTSNAELGLENPHVLDSGHGIIVNDDGSFFITLENKDSNINDKNVLMAPYIDSGTVQWDCTGGDLEVKYRPSICRK